MPTKVIEFHGFQPLSGESKAFASRRWCPFVDDKCKKSQSGGACALQAPNAKPVIICPNRLYGNQFEVIWRIARQTFGDDCDLVTDLEAETRRRNGTLNGREVIVFGQGYSGEVGIKAPSAEGESGSFKVGVCVILCPGAFSYAMGKRSSNMMASWLLTRCHSRTERFHSTEVALSAK